MMLRSVASCLVAAVGLTDKQSLRYLCFTLDSESTMKRLILLPLAVLLHVPGENIRVNSSHNRKKTIYCN